MEQLVFFAVIIIFSILESIARSRKAKQRRESGEAEPEQFEWAQETPWEAEELPTYDDDPSYDELPSYDSRYEEPEREPQPPADLGDIWAEITGLARERQEQEERERREAAKVVVARQSPPLPVSVPETRPDHYVHQAHAEYGTDPSERSPSAQDGLDPLAVSLSADAAAARAQLLSRGRELRQAIILQEVLGPPAAFREDDRDLWE